MAYSTSDIRNVCLVGPSGAGKTQLAEALLHELIDGHPPLWPEIPGEPC